MHKLLAFLMTTALLFSLSACAGKTEQSAAPTTNSAAETNQPTASPIDYAVFCGHYSDTETVEGPCYTVSIISVDNATKAIEISLSYVGINASPVYTTESIHTSVASDHTAQFEWEDSWANQGVGTLVLNPDDPSAVQLMMAVTKEAEVNRATLSTNDQYKTFMRR